MENVTKTNEELIGEFITAQNKQNELLSNINREEINSLNTHSKQSLEIDTLKKSNEEIVKNVNSAFKARFNALKESNNNAMSNKELIKASFLFVKSSLGADVHKDTLKIVDTLEFYYNSKFYAKNHLTFKVLQNLKSLSKYITKSAFADVYSDTLLDETKEATLWNKAKSLKRLYALVKKDITMSETQTLNSYVDVLKIDTTNAIIEINLQNFSSFSLDDLDKVLNAVSIAKLTKKSINAVLGDTFKDRVVKTA